MKKRILAAALACVLLAGCGVRTPAPAEETPEERPVIAYVPLDDRPDNVERVVYLAESVGYSLVMPEADLYRTRLDGQPTNENGTQYGDIAALYEWVLDQEAAGCDRYILSMDQLLSGGLVNSRHTAETLAVDFAAAQGWPLVLVASGRLGSINHIILSLEAAKARGMSVAGVVYNWSPDADPTIDADTPTVTRRAMERLGFPPVLIKVSKQVRPVLTDDIDFAPLFAQGKGL